MTQPMSDYLTVDEVAEMFRTSPGALYTQRHRQELPGALGLKVGKRVLYHRDDIERWLQSLRDARVEKLR